MFLWEISYFRWHKIFLLPRWRNSQGQWRTVVSPVCSILSVHSFNKPGVILHKSRSYSGYGQLMSCPKNVRYAPAACSTTSPCINRRLDRGLMARGLTFRSDPFPFQCRLVGNGSLTTAGETHGMERWTLWELPHICIFLLRRNSGGQFLSITESGWSCTPQCAPRVRQGGANCFNTRCGQSQATGLC